jgi:hypothetical protein
VGHWWLRSGSGYFAPVSCDLDERDSSHVEGVLTVNAIHRQGVLAFVVSLIALFVALGGTAGASEQAAVPLAKRALVADNAKKLGGQTAAQIIAKGAVAGAALSAQTAGPASTAASLVVIKTQAAGAIPAGTGLATFSVTCDTGTKVIGGGMSSDGALATFDSYPKSDTTWEVVVGANASVYAICLK